MTTTENNSIKVNYYYKTLNNNINNIDKNTKEKDIKNKKRFKRYPNNQNKNILKIHIFKILNKNIILNNIIILMLIVIFYPIFIFNKKNKKFIKLNPIWNIEIKIKGIGNKNILSQKKDKENYFNYTPTQVYVNGVIQNYTGFTANLTSDINKVNIKWDYEITNCNFMFYGLTDILEIDLSNFDSSKVTNMIRLFQGCTSLTSINLKNFSTKSAKDMRSMFSQCILLTSLDLSNFDTSSANRMDSLFYNCTSLKSLNLSNFVTSKVINMAGMFSSCISLTSLDLNNFRTSLVQDMSNMFKDCNSLVYLDIDNFDTSSVLNMINMFSGCTILTSLNVNSFDTSKVNNMAYMFNNCASLLSLNLNNFQTTNLINITSMFSGCNNIVFCMNETKIPEIALELNSTNPNFIINCSYLDLFKDNRQFIEDEKNKKCSTIDFLNNTCKIDNNLNEINTMINNIRNEIISNHTLDSLLATIFTGEKNDILIEDYNIKYQLTSSDNQNNKKYYNVSTIKLGECEKELKEYYKMGDNASLLIFKVDYYDESSTTPIVEYEVYDFKNKKKLNLSICQNITIEIDIPVSIDEDNIFKYNLSSEYYNDRCYPYTTEQGTDVILSDRKNEYYQNNMTLCEENCDYNGYDNETKKAICECKIKESFLSIFEINFDTDTLKELFFNVNNTINIYVIRCYKLLFSIDGLIKNIGSYILIFIIMTNIPLLIIFILKEFKILIKKIYEITKSNKNENREIYKSKTNIFQTNLMKNSKIRKMNNSLNSNIKSEITLRKLNNKSKNNPPKSKKKNDKLNNNESKTTDFINGKSIKKLNINNNNINIYVKKLNSKNKNKNKKKEKEKEKENVSEKKVKKLNDYEFNNLKYKEALKLDKRSYIEYYISLLKRKQLFIFTFYTKDDYNSGVIKISLFLFSFSLYFFVNTLFFTDSTMHKIYEDKGKFNFLYQIRQIIYSTIISSVNNIIISYLSLSEKNILKIKEAKEKNENNLNSLVSKIRKCLIIKFILFYIFNFYLLLSFWFYLGCFCVVYTNTQIHLIKDTLISYSLSLVYPLGLNLLPGFFRIPALKAQKQDKECLYNFSKILQLL